MTVTGLALLDASEISNEDPTGPSTFGKQFLDSMKAHGFAKLANHGIPAEEVATVFQVSKKFFDLPDNVKSAIAHDKKSEFQRGWSFEGEEKTWGLFNGAGTGGTEGSVDRKDHIDFGYPANKAFPNKWLPEEKIPGYREVMERFYDECAKVSQRLLMVLAIELGLPPREFADRCNKYESSTMRINHFPAMPVQDIDSGAASRIWPHFDLGCISLVFPDIVGGLEMENRQQPGSWIPVACGSRAELCVNLGEQWQSLVNGRIPAGLHRVTKPRAENEIVNGMAPERISLAFFCKMDFNASVGPLPQFVDKNHPPAYEDITALRFQQIRNRATY